MESKQFYFFEKETVAYMPPCADTEVLCDLWNGFCSRAGVLICKGGEDNITALLLENVKEKRKND